MNSAEISLLQIIHHIAKSHPNLHYYIDENNFPGLGTWKHHGFPLPCPKTIKDSVLLRHNLPDAVWVETGTYQGETTQLLSKVSSFVYTIEPEPTLYSNAVAKFEGNSRVTVINDISENALPLLLPELSGNICFWLDGHFSGGVTYAGPNDTPLVYELAHIEKFLKRFQAVTILIDDIRLCGRKHAYGDYPSLDFLVNWSRSNGLKWFIEYDIFIAKKDP